MNIEKIQKAINKTYEPLKFKVRHVPDTNIVKWTTQIGGMDFQCQSSGEFEEQVHRPYSLNVWASEQFIPLLTFLKQREEELAGYMELWKGDK